MKNRYLYKFHFYIFLFSSLFIYSCKDTDVVGLEVQPSSDRIEISSSNFGQNDSLFSITISTESVDSLRSDETSSLLLGSMFDPIFGFIHSSFFTQISLSESNIDLGDNPIADSVVFSYSYSGYYGDLTSFNELEVYYCTDNIYKDSIYYSNYAHSDCDNSLNGLLASFEINSDTSISPTLKMNLGGGIGQQILDMGTDDLLIDNETFKDNFGYFKIIPNTPFSHSMALNTILYLNPSGSNTVFTVYYHNNSSDSLSLDFVLDGESARINIFNEKPLSVLNLGADFAYVQSMAGFKSKLVLQNTNLLAGALEGKAINKVTLSFDIENDENYPAHENLSLVRVDSSGNNIFLSDYITEGVTHFGGSLDNDQYTFNITRYFYNLLYDSSFTSDLYLLSSGGSINANRTVIKNSSLKITVLYSDL
jgi:hypothetical protein